MTKKELKIISGQIVVESKLTKPSKLQLLNWIQNEASQAQIKAFLMDGKIVKLDEQSEEIVNARFESHPLNEGGWKTIGGMILIGPVYWAAYRGIRALFDKKSAQCGVLGIGRKRDVCLWKLRAEQARKEASLFSKVAKDCVKSKDPAKCKASVAAKVAKSNAKAQKYEDKIKTYSVKDPKKHAKAQAGLKYAKEPGAKVT